MCPVGVCNTSSEVGRFEQSLLLFNPSSWLKRICFVRSRRLRSARFMFGALQAPLLVVPAERADVKEKCQVCCRGVTTGFRKFFYSDRIFRHFSVRPNFQPRLQKRGPSERGARCQAIYIVGYQTGSQNQGLSHQARKGNLLARDAAGCRASGLRRWLRHKMNPGRRRMRSRRDRAVFSTIRPPSDYGPRTNRGGATSVSPLE